MDLKPEDLRIETYRPASASRWVNVADTGVRITHMPTGLFAMVDGERSQHRNKALAMSMLVRQVKEERAKNKQARPKKEWGSW